jgi:hypothetical protein
MIRWGMIPPYLGDVFFKATFLAQQSKSSEINIDILLAALDASEVDPSSFLPPAADLTGSECYASFTNSDWTPVSTDAAKALAPFAGMEKIDLPILRKALLAAKEK